MLFNSYIFIFAFLPCTFFVYFGLCRFDRFVWAKVWLVLASLFFYAYWDWKYVPLLVFSILFNYGISQFIISAKEKSKRKLYFLIGLMGNIALLCYFKYMDFFIGNFNALFDLHIDLLGIIIPLGISFFTITQIAYLVDCYEKIAVDRDFVNYALFVTYFPHLLAGPILHHKDMMKQFSDKSKGIINYENIVKGLFYFFIGLFKKVVIADQFGEWANIGYAQLSDGNLLNFFEAWTTVYAYAFQLYFDFSGYCDMALGASLMFNIKIPINFNSPFKATGMIDFWKRWHITLTNFITAYIYTPMLRSLGNITFNKAMACVLISFLIAGLWHGAGWNFIIYGLLHGIGLVVNHFWQKKTKIKMPKVLAWFITFHYVILTWIFFRAENLEIAKRMFESIVNFDNIEQSFEAVLLPYIEMIRFKSPLFVIKNIIESQVLLFILTFIIVLVFRNSHEFIRRFVCSWKWLFFLVLIATCSLTSFNKHTQFLYFNF